MCCRKNAARCGTRVLIAPLNARNYILVHTTIVKLFLTRLTEQYNTYKYRLVERMMNGWRA